MNASWAGATQNSPWNLKRATVRALRPAVLAGMREDHVPHVVRIALALDLLLARDLVDGPAVPGSRPARFAVPDAALAVSSPAGSTPTNGMTFAAAIPAANPCRYSFCAGVKEAEGGWRSFV